MRRRAITHQLTLILGGARSGKSTYAEQLAATLAPQGDVLYVATAQAWDEEMAGRIARHQAERPPAWRTVEAARATGAAVARALAAQPAAVVLFDCLTLLTSNVLIGLPEDADEMQGQAAMQTELDGLMAVYASSSAHWIVVSNEVGLGIVPAYPLGRLYRDVLGRVNQQLAARADTVQFMVAGLPMTLKSPEGNSAGR